MTKQKYSKFSDRPPRNVREARRTTNAGQQWYKKKPHESKQDSVTTVHTKLLRGNGFGCQHLTKRIPKAKHDYHAVLATVLCCHIKKKKKKLHLHRHFSPAFQTFPCNVVGPSREQAFMYITRYTGAIKSNWNTVCQIYRNFFFQKRPGCIAVRLKESSLTEKASWKPVLGVQYFAIFLNPCFNYLWRHLYM